MKAEARKQEPEFKPIELVITIESANELRLLQKLFMRNDTVAQVLLNTRYVYAHEAHPLKTMMGRISEVLSSHHNPNTNSQ